MAWEDSIFAPTPPLESLRMVVSDATTDFSDEPKKVHVPRSPHRTQVLAIDISRAYFNAVTLEGELTFGEFPPEVGTPPGMCSLLYRCMYGTRRVANGWQGECSGSYGVLDVLREQRPRVFFRHKERQLVCSVHGDDFTVAGHCSSLD